MTTTPKRRNIQKEVALKLIDRIKSSGKLPWECPWVAAPGANLIPKNYSTEKAYSGMNIFILWAEAEDKGYSTNLWMTARQAFDLGGRIRKGETATLCLRYGTYQKKELNEETGLEEEVTRAFSKGFPLFNVEQIDDLDITLPSLTVEPGKCVSEIDQLASIYAENTGLYLSVSGGQAYYSRGLDQVNMPDREFKSAEAYTATKAHELIHSTGHKKRLGRFDELDGRFDTHDENYAFEELVAELGAAMVCAELGVQGQHDQHASYLQGWLRALDNDYRYLTKAAAAASKAHSLIMKGGILESDSTDEASSTHNLQSAA